MNKEQYLQFLRCDHGQLIAPFVTTKKTLDRSGHGSRAFEVVRSESRDGFGFGRLDLESLSTPAAELLTSRNDEFPRYGNCHVTVIR